MAGSFNHIVDDDGKFTMDLIDHKGDAWEALEDCYIIILELSGGDMSKISAACKKHNLVDPWREDRDEDEPQKAPMKI